MCVQECGPARAERTLMRITFCHNVNFFSSLRSLVPYFSFYIHFALALYKYIYTFMHVNIFKCIHIIFKPYAIGAIKNTLRPKQLKN